MVLFSSGYTFMIFFYNMYNVGSGGLLFMVFCGRGLIKQFLFLLRRFFSALLAPLSIHFSMAKI